jgi:hypothetical protein
MSYPSHYVVQPTDMRLARAASPVGWPDSGERELGALG